MFTKKIVYNDILLLYELSERIFNAFDEKHFIVAELRDFVRNDSMIRGLEFNIPQDEKRVLPALLGETAKRFSWFIPENETEVWDSDGNSFFVKETYSGEEFFSLIQNECKIVFLKLQAYSNETENKDIKTYGEYLKSRCTAIVLICDCEEAEIYAKDEDFLYTVKQNAQTNLSCRVEIKTDENDGRTGMEIITS